MSIYQVNGTLIFLSLGLMLYCSCRGQVQVDNGESPITKDKIASNELSLSEAIWSIHQDRNDHYWFGSNGQGIFYYDGKKLTNFTTKDGLAGNQIRDIQEDKLGNLYFDTAEGVSKFDGKQFTTLTPISLPSNVWQLKPDDLWFKMSGNPNGVYRYDGESLYHLTFPEQDLKQVDGIEQESSNYSPYGIYSIYKDQKGYMWFGTLTAGVFRYDGTSFLWIGEKELGTLEDGRVPGVRSIIEDKEGNFWLSNVLYRYALMETKLGTSYEKLEGILGSELKEKVNLPYYLSAITDDKDLWMVTYAEGVWRYDGEKLIQYEIKNDGRKVYLYAIYKDKQGTIWLGTHDAGVYQFDGESFMRFAL